MTDQAVATPHEPVDMVTLEKSFIDADVQTLMEMQEDYLMKSALAADAGAQKHSDAYLFAVRELEQLKNGLQTIPHLKEEAP